jgi:hypothetical protein
MRALTLCLSFLAFGCGDDTTNTNQDLSASGDMSMAGAPTCSTYCSKIQSACTGAGGDGGAGHAQYPDTATCTSYCSSEGWPTGMSGDTSGNTLGCRIYHATAAASDPTTHCPHAGPSGGNVCGTWCDNYCQLMAKNCTGSNAVYDAATCMTKCMTIPTTGNPGATSGNSVQCRIYHLGVAATDPTTHCPHSKTLTDLPTGPCM